MIFLPPILIKTIITGLVKAAAAMIAFSLTVLVTRTLGAEESGLFLLAFSVISVLSIFFRLGLDNVILRWVGAEGVSPFAQQKLNLGLTWVALTTIPVTLIIELFADPLILMFFNKPEFVSVFRCIILGLPAMSLFMLLALAFQGQHRVVATTVFQNLGLSTLFVGVFIFLWSQAEHLLTARNSALIYAICAWLMFFMALCLWFKQPRVMFKIKQLKDADLWKSCSNLWVASTMSSVVGWSGIIVAGVLVPSDEFAYLSAAHRTASLTCFVLMVVNIVVAPRYAKLWQEKKIDEIQLLAKRSTRGMIALAFPVVGIMIFFSEYIMAFFGQGFERGAALLSIIALGQLINVATGSVAYLLNMSGHEKDFRRMTLFTGPFTFISAMIFTKYWGVLGAAYATALGLVIQNLFALIMVKKRLGFWPLG